MKRIGTCMLAACLFASGLGCKAAKNWTGELPANATTGYSWVQCETTGEDSACVAVTLGYTAGKSAPDFVGAPGMATVEVSGNLEGEARVTLCYVQPWDWDGTVETAAAVAKYRFFVDDSLIVTLVDSEIRLAPGMQE